MSGDVLLELDGGVATLTLAREHRRNAIDVAFAAAIRDALRQARDADARALVLRSAGPVFSAGVDLSEPIRLDPGSPDLVVADALLTSAPYVVMAVEGPALAGGLLFAALSPVVIAGADARFWLPERSIGLFPGRVLAYLEQVVPARAAHWLGVTEHRIHADQARTLGLVSEVVAAGAATARAQEIAAGLAAAPPGFVDAAREAWRAQFRTPDFEARRRELDGLLAENLAARRTKPS